MKAYLAALQFLTVIPIPSKVNLTKDDFANSPKYFPLVGAFLGAILAGVAFGLNSVAVDLRSVLIVAMLYLITGAFHLDALADSFDGLYGVREKSKRLEIMRDSNVGVMGVAAIVICMALKLALLNNIELELLYKALIAMLVFGRWAQTYACYAFSYARDDGKALLFIDNTRNKDILFATFCTVLILYIMFGLQSVAVITVAFTCTKIFMLWVYSKIKGMTGDTIGASSEIAELAILMTVYFFTVWGIL